VSTLFISDLHLCGNRPQTLALFSQFLRDYQHANRLYILGDLFDAWIGDDYHDPALLDILAQLKAYCAGTPTYFMHGNRDFLIGEAFAREIGCQLLQENEIIQLGDKRLLIMHGDTLCSDDIEYQRFRQQVRNQQWLDQVLALDIEQRLQMARQFRLDSSNSKAMKAEEIMDVNQDTVEQSMRQFDVRLLLHGHTHRPGIHRFQLQQQDARRYVLSDWSDHAVIARHQDNGEIELLNIHLKK